MPLASFLIYADGKSIISEKIRQSGRKSVHWMCRFQPRFLLNTTTSDTYSKMFFNCHVTKQSYVYVQCTWKMWNLSETTVDWPQMLKWQLKQRPLVKSIQWFHAYKCWACGFRACMYWKAVSNSGFLLIVSSGFMPTNIEMLSSNIGSSSRKYPELFLE